MSFNRNIKTRYRNQIKSHGEIGFSSNVIWNVAGEVSIHRVGGHADEFAGEAESVNDVVEIDDGFISDGYDAVGSEGGIFIGVNEHHTNVAVVARRGGGG